MSLISFGRLFRIRAASNRKDFMPYLVEKPGIYRRHPLNMHFGRATVAEWVSKQNSHPFKVMQKRQSCGLWYGHMYLSDASYTDQSYWMCDKCDRDFMLKTAAVYDVKVQSNG